MKKIRYQKKISESNNNSLLPFYTILFLICLVAIIMLINNIYYIKAGDTINSKITNCTWYCRGEAGICEWYPVVLFQDSTGQEKISQVSLSYSPLKDCPQRIGDNLLIRDVKNRDNVLMASENIRPEIIFISIAVLMALFVFIAKRYSLKK